ncbi:MAG: GNAT family N-acetyltransferase [Thermotaleaceae bacterium]
MTVLDANKIINKKLEWIIRSSQVSDAASLINFIKRIEEETDFLLREPGEFRMTVNEEEEFIRQKLEDSQALHIIAEIDGNIVGALGFQGNNLKRYRHQGEFGLSVLKQYWNRGIGSSLLDTLLKWAEGNNFRRISLQVDATNEKARRLYERFGFVTEGRLVEDINMGNGMYRDSLIMARYSRGCRPCNPPYDI